MFVIIWKKPGKEVKVFAPFTSAQVAEVYKQYYIAEPSYAFVVRAKEVHGIWQKDQAKATEKALVIARESSLSA